MRDKETDKADHASKGNGCCCQKPYRYEKNKALPAGRKAEAMGKLVSKDQGIKGLCPEQGYDDTGSHKNKAIGYL